LFLVPFPDDMTLLEGLLPCAKWYGWRLRRMGLESAFANTEFFTWSVCPARIPCPATVLPNVLEGKDAPKLVWIAVWEFCWIDCLGDTDDSSAPYSSSFYMQIHSQKLYLHSAISIQWRQVYSVLIFCNNNCRI
jgi:hypothetical protein